MHLGLARGLVALVKCILLSLITRPQLELAQQWLGMDAALRQQIKTSLLSTLATPVRYRRRWQSSSPLPQENEVRHTSALVIAKVAAIEIPQNAWPDLIASLLSNMGAAAGNDGLRQATLESLGWVPMCQCVRQAY